MYEMKKLILLTLVVGIMASGCGTIGMNGILYTGVEEPVNATSNSRGTKTGEASCTNVLGLVAVGDCSIDAAAKKGGINNIKSVDQKTTSVLGLFVKRTTVVTGD